MQKKLDAAENPSDGHLPGDSDERVAQALRRHYNTENKYMKYAIALLCALSVCGCDALLEPEVEPYEPEEQVAPRVAWGAVAIRQTAGRPTNVSISYGRSTEAAAEAAALARCGTGCTIWTTFRNGCIAVAGNRVGQVAYATDADLNRATVDALGLCNQGTEIPCTLSASGCSR